MCVLEADPGCAVSLGCRIPNAQPYTVFHFRLSQFLKCVSASDASRVLTRTVSVSQSLPSSEERGAHTAGHPGQTVCRARTVTTCRRGTKAGRDRVIRLGAKRWQRGGLHEGGCGRTSEGTRRTTCGTASV